MAKPKKEEEEEEKAKVSRSSIFNVPSSSPV